jgi:hypothetical protein
MMVKLLTTNMVKVTKVFITENTEISHWSLLGEALAAPLGEHSEFWPSITKMKLDCNSAFDPFNLQIWPVLSCGLNSWLTVAWVVTVSPVLTWML